MASKQSNENNFFVEKRLKEIEEAGLYRRLRKVSAEGPLATVDGVQVIHLCSNDYLGLSQKREVVNAAARALSRQVSQCSSRLIAGNDPAFLKLEDMLARHRGTEAALVHPTGYAANLGAVGALAGKDSIIFSDELNHASIIDACRLSGAEVRVFRHNDTGHLAQLLREEKNRKRRMVITEGIFSMDGDAADLREICELAQEHGAMTVVDDAHGDFIFGPEFSGVPAMAGVA
ncbi:MAG: 8-amino-7-oxononanoate synthase, partial [Nitrososphaera sp.]